MLKQKGRGAIDHESDLNSGIIVAKWMDNNAVHVASDFVGVEPIGTVKRWSGEQKSKIDVECPQLVLFFNKGMGGVDLADMLISLYRISCKTRRWYLKIFWHLVDIAKVNSWLLYRRHGDVMKIPKGQRKSVVDFTMSIAEALICAGKTTYESATPKRVGRPKKRSLEEATQPNKPGRRPTMPLPCSDTQYDQMSHWPEPSNDKQGRCRHCKYGFSKIYCSKCRVCLCLRYGKDCFLEYHTK